MRCGAIAMSLIKLDAHRQKITTNIGDWLSAKVYSDVKGNKCSCGGKFTSFSVIKRRKGDIKYPTCNECGCAPEKLRIKAKVIDQNFKSEYRDIRHHDGQRLTEINDVLGILNQIDREIELGIFDVKKYDSKKRRDSYLFSYFLHCELEKDGEEGYLEHHRNREARGEIEYYGMKHKIKYCRVLEKFFGKMDLAIIDEVKIDEFKSSFTSKFSNMRGGLQELRPLLKLAYKRKKIPRVPLFDPIPSAPAREDSEIDINFARKCVSSMVEKQYRVMGNAQTEFALRGCETRGIKLKDCDVEEERFKIARHFSGSKESQGRKSIKTGKQATLEFDMTKEFKSWIVNECKWLGPEDFIFQQIPQKFREGKNGGFIPAPGGKALGESTLPKYWKRHLEKKEIPHFPMYEFRGARATEIAEDSNGNVLETSYFLGHTNTKTTEKHYIKKKNTNSKFIKKEGRVLPMAK